MQPKLVIWTAVMILTTMVASPVSARFSIGEEVIVEAGETVDNAMSGGHNVIVRGTVREDAISFGGNVIVESGGRVEHNAMSFGGNVDVHSGGRVEEDAVTIGGMIRVRPGGSVHGERVSGLSPRVGRIGNQFKNIFLVTPFSGVFGLFGSIFGLILFMFKLLFSLLIAVLITFMFPQGIDRMAAIGQKETPKTLVMGLIMLFLIPLTLLFLVITLIGIPMVPVVILFLAVAYLLGKTGVALLIGLSLPNGVMRSRMANVVLGVLVIALLKLIPIIGFFVGIAVTLAAFGVILNSRFGTRLPDPAVSSPAGDAAAV